MSGVGSDQWIERFAAAVADLDPGATRITVLHRIVDGPAWLVRVGDGGIAVERVDAADTADTADTADVSFTWQQADAEAVADGAMSALVPFQAGRLRVGGDLHRLSEAAALFARFPAIAGGGGRA
jgi:hypothetical protein